MRELTGWGGGRGGGYPPGLREVQSGSVERRASRPTPESQFTASRKIQAKRGRPTPHHGSVKCRRCSAEVEGRDRCPECGVFQPGNKQRVQRGNSLARIHGSRSEQVVSQRRRELDDLNNELKGALGSEP